MAFKIEIAIGIDCDVRIATELIVIFRANFNGEAIEIRITNNEIPRNRRGESWFGEIEPSALHRGHRSVCVVTAAGQSELAASQFFESTRPGQRAAEGK